jgi:regulator of protease activity HflC (stomatin/prohibitin superfamily)
MSITYYILLLLALPVVVSMFHVVPEYQRLVVFRLGRQLDKPKGPGIVLLIPVIDRAVKVDLREQKREVSDQTARTQNSLPVLFSFRWYYKVIDPVKSVINVGNFGSSMAGIAATVLIKLIEDLNSVDITTNLQSMNTKARTRLDEITQPWGVKVTEFEILKIVVDDRRKEIDDAIFTIGKFGETQTTVHTTGTILIGDRSWDAISSKPIPPKSKVRVKRVIVEVEDDISAG